MSDYKAQQLAKLEATRHKRAAAVRRFFDPGLDEQSRLAAARQSGTFVDAEVPLALAIVDDPTATPLLRASALNGLFNRLSSDEALVARFIDLLNASSEPRELRLVALATLQASRFGSSAMAGLRPKYLASLRKLIDQDDDDLRRHALEYLMLEKDDYAEQRLLDGLNDPAKAFLPPEIAIQLLANDLHADAVPTLRAIARNPPSAAARKEALRNLATDAESAPLLAETARDANEHPEIRHVSAVALHQIDPGLARQIMRELIEADATDHELKAALLNSLAHLDATPRDGALTAKLVELADATDSEDLKSMIALFTSKP